MTAAILLRKSYAKYSNATQEDATRLSSNDETNTCTILIIKIARCIVLVVTDLWEGAGEAIPTPVSDGVAGGLHTCPH